MSNVRIKLNDIVCDDGIQVRCGINDEVVTDYAERMQEEHVFPAITLFYDGKRYFLADGYHRVAAAQTNGDMEIDADVREGTREDALWFALAANKQQGQRMTPGDKKHAVELALNTWPGKKQTDIASQVGCTPQYVSKIAKSLKSTGCFEATTTVTNTRGQNRPASYQQKRKRTDASEEAIKEQEARAEEEGCLSRQDGKVETRDPADPAAEEVKVAHISQAEQAKTPEGVAAIKTAWGSLDEAGHEEIQRFIEDETENDDVPTGHWPRANKIKNKLCRYIDKNPPPAATWLIKDLEICVAKWHAKKAGAA